jgi:hypothetical protein
MTRLALSRRRSGDSADDIAVYSEYLSRENRPHLLAYFGGRLGPGRWCSERILVERSLDESTALVTRMGDWKAGSTFVRRSGSSRYEPAECEIVGSIDSDVEDRIYELVNRWVYWEAGILRLKLENVGSEFSDRVAEVGGVDATTVSELRAIWMLSAEGSG